MRKFTLTFILSGFSIISIAQLEERDSLKLLLQGFGSLYAENVNDVALSEGFLGIAKLFSLHL